MKKLALLVVAVIMVLSPIAAQALSIGTWNNWPTIGQKFNDKLTGYLGFNYYSSYNNKATSWGLVKLDYNLIKIGEVQTKVGIDCWGSNPFYDSGIDTSYGISFMPLSNLSVGFDVMLLSSYNAVNVSSIDVFDGARAVINLYF